MVKEGFVIFINLSLMPSSLSHIANVYYLMQLGGCFCARNNC